MTVIRGKEGDVVGLSFVDTAMPGAGLAQLVAQVQQHAPGVPVAIGVVVIPASLKPEIVSGIREIDDDDPFTGEVLVP